jgi:PPP family 3-phenylpropionic acid transporter
MLLPKLFYFVYFGAVASIGPFFGLYYQELGLAGSQIGVLTALPPLIMMVAAPLWSGLADMTRQHKRVMLITLAGAWGCLWILQRSARFYPLLLVVSLYAFFLSPVLALVDNAVLAMLGPRRADYGKQRVLGSLGPGIAGPLVSAWADRIGLRAAFYSALAFMACAWGVASRLDIQSGVDKPPNDAQPPLSFRQGLRVLLTDRRLTFFLLIAFLGMMGRSTTFTYLFPYMETLGAPKSMMGFTMTVLTIGEVPFLLYSGKILARWDTRGMIIMSLLASAAMLLTISWMQVPWLAVLAHLLHGFSYSGMWVAGVSHASELAPPGLGATAQGVFSAVFSGLASACGAFLGGLLYEHLGPASMFRWAGITVLSGLALFVLNTQGHSADS